jgi:GTP-binding protein HflX
LKQTFSTERQKERALLIGISHAQDTQGHLVEDYLEELALLADTAGVEVAGTMTQNLKRLDPSTYIGKGKVQEIAAKVQEEEIQVVIFDEDLSPAQAKNLENAIKTKIIDRSALILDIFAKRARTHESKTQVELAQLQYLLPRLTRQWTHLERQAGGGVFTKGPGETQLETDRRLIGKRISVLKDELKKIETQRHTQRASRRELFKAALVGYTNAGKSTLLNAISDAGVFVEDRLFATLDATTRRVYLNAEHPCLISDTVGFIRKLPHHLVASFRSTLEEVRDADLLIHIVDLSNHLFHEQMETVQKVLEELDAAKNPLLTVFNKVDKVTDENILLETKKRFPHSLFISAGRRIGLDKLRAAVIEHIETAYVTATMAIDPADGKLYAMVHYLADVLEVQPAHNRTLLTFRARKEDFEKITAYQNKHRELSKIHSEKE